jgi:uncharacterized protein (TIGR02996 family)
MNIDALNEVLKYLTDKKEDFYPAVVDPNEHTPHLMLADFLNENGDPETAERIRTEVKKQQEYPQAIKPTRLGGDHVTDHDFVLAAVRSGHPNPTVRALASRVIPGLPPKEKVPENTNRRNDLIDLLLHSDPQTRPHDHDVAVTLAPSDPVRSHTAHSRLRRINGAGGESGLEAKVVRGVMYLLDHEHPDRNAFGAPGILFTSPVNDDNELDELEAHAQNVRAERSPEGFGPAHMGPVAFGS